MRELDQLRALRAVRAAVDTTTNWAIISARRRHEHRGGSPASWAAIGDALGVTGQAVGKRARARNLPVEPMTPERYEQLVSRGRKPRGERHDPRDSQYPRRRLAGEARRPSPVTPGLTT